MDSEQIIPLARLFADAMNQLSFVSAIVGGFAIALLAGVLGREKRPLTQWTVGVLSTAALLQISCTLFFTLASARILILSANKKWGPLNDLVAGIDPSLGPFIVAFFASFLLFFVGIALTGWLFGKRTGWVATGVATLAFGLAFFGLTRVM
jgi:hypothetical protein